MRGVIDTIAPNVAVVLVGDDKEPWDFPLSSVPKGASPDTVLILERTANSLRVVDIDVAGQFRRGASCESRTTRASRGLRELRNLANR